MSDDDDDDEEDEADDDASRRADDDDAIAAGGATNAARAEAEDWTRISSAKTRTGERLPRDMRGKDFIVRGA